MRVYVTDGVKDQVDSQSVIGVAVSGRVCKAEKVKPYSTVCLIEVLVCADHMDPLDFACALGKFARTNVP